MAAAPPTASPAAPARELLARFAAIVGAENCISDPDQIARVLTEIARLAEHWGVRVANVFHAGDGNLHPLVLYDASVADEARRAEQCSGAIVRLCISAGGSITGEHGVGVDKAAYMGEMFSDTDLETMNWLRCAFAPETRFNPGKVFPTPRLCGDRPGKYVPHATEIAGQIGRG